MSNLEDSYFDDDGWKFYIGPEDTSLISVTTVLSKGIPYDGHKVPEDKLIEAGKFGTDFHQICENILLGRPNPEIPEDMKKHHEEFEKWLKEDKIEVLSVEEAGQDLDWGVAGRWDWILSVNREPFLCDLKTSSRWAVQNGWQMAEYRKMAIQKGVIGEECGIMGIHIPRRTGNLSKFQYRHIDGMLLAFAATLQALKWKHWHKLNKMDWPWLNKPTVKLCREDA